MNNTVFIFGAGFSAIAGMPVQADIMRKIVSRVSQYNVRHTIGHMFSLFQVEDIAEVPLEDIFTMFDRARNARETIGRFSHQQIEDSYKTLVSSITAEFDRRLSGFTDEPYSSFMRSLFEKQISDRNENESQPASFCIITLNWDTILDYLIEKLGISQGVSADYGCYSYNLEDTDPCEQFKKNRQQETSFIKLLKLHGSLNWLICTSCGRLFFSNSTSRPPVFFPYVKLCRYCTETLLESLIITPTLVKNINQTHLNMVWHNALLKLQQAKRIVFVGYSFPLADFEFRYMLLKAIIGNHNVIVRVLLYPPDDLIESEAQRIERSKVEARYRNFFGSRDIDFKYMSAEGFMTDPLMIWHW